MKILVVEDQPIELKLAITVLTAAGHDVARADAADIALAAIRENVPDLVLLDLSLPGTDGLTLARKIRADPATRAITIVAVTSYPEEFTRAASLAAGCDAWLSKPLSTRTLPHVLAKLAAPPEPDSLDDPSDHSHR